MIDPIRAQAEARAAELLPCLTFQRDDSSAQGADLTLPRCPEKMRAEWSWCEHCRARSAVEAELERLMRALAAEKAEHNEACESYVKAAGERNAAERERDAIRAQLDRAVEALERATDWIKNRDDFTSDNWVGKTARNMLANFDAVLADLRGGGK